MEHILIVEDEPDTATTLAVLIEERGHRVVIAQNGEDALQKLSSEGPPCLIILDLLLPGMSGWQLRVELLAHAEYSEIPVVLLSGLADIEQHAKILRAVNYLAKPFATEKLYGILEEYC